MHPYLGSVVGFAFCELKNAQFQRIKLSRTGFWHRTFERTPMYNQAQRLPNNPQERGDTFGKHARAIMKQFEVDEPSLS